MLEPQSLSYMLAQPFAVGWWCANCCIEGLYQLETQADVDDLRTGLESERCAQGVHPSYQVVAVGVWPTEAEARVTLAQMSCHG